MERSEQIERIGKKICLILGADKNVGPALYHKYEGGGKVATLVLRATHGNMDIVDAARTLLTDFLGLKLKDEQRGHGKGQTYTLLVPLSSVSTESLEQINSLTQEIIKRENSNGKVIRADKPKKVEPSEKEEVSTQTALIPVVDHKREMSDTAKYRLALSRYLRPIMEMEGITPNQFSFDKDISGRLIVVHCQNEEIAKMIEKAIVYTSSFVSKSVVEREGSLVMVDGSKFYGLEHKPFAFPPKRGDLAVIREKIQSICSFKMENVSSTDGDRFSISFSRETAAKKTAKIIEDLGWNLVGVSADGKSIIFKGGYAEPKEPDTISSIPDPAPIAPVISTLVPPSREAILKELKSMMTICNLSPETMDRIQKAIMDDLKRNNPEEYAKILLVTLGY